MIFPDNVAEDIYGYDVGLRRVIYLHISNPFFDVSAWYWVARHSRSVFVLQPDAISC